MLVIGGLLFTALVLVIVIWATLGDDPAPSTAPPKPTVPTATRTDPVATPVDPAIALFDPDGDGAEPADDVTLAFDGTPATSWQSLCYRDSRLGGKRGVGLLVDLGTPQAGTFTADIASAPYGVQIMTAADGQAPTSFDQMEIVKRAEARRAGTISVAVGPATRYVAVVFVGLARDNACPAGRPFRGAVTDVQWSPA